MGPGELNLGPQTMPPRGTTVVPYPPNHAAKRNNGSGGAEWWSPTHAAKGNHAGVYPPNHAAKRNNGPDLPFWAEQWHPDFDIEY